MFEYLALSFVCLIPNEFQLYPQSSASVSSTTNLHSQMLSLPTRIFGFVLPQAFSNSSPFRNLSGISVVMGNYEFSLMNKYPLVKPGYQILASGWLVHNTETVCQSLLKHILGERFKKSVFNLLFINQNILLAYIITNTNLVMRYLIRV